MNTPAQQVGSDSMRALFTRVHCPGRGERQIRLSRDIFGNLNKYGFQRRDLPGQPARGHRSRRPRVP